MTKQVQFRRGTTAQHTTFTGALAEVTVDTDLDVVVVHDGSTVGGQQMVGRTATQTLTNKSVNLSSNTFTGTIAQFNTALSDADFATLAGSETLTNKTLSTPTFTGNPILGDNVILHFGSATASTGDLQVKSNGTTSSIEERTSALRIYSNDLYLQDYANAKIYLRAQASGSVQLYHNNANKLETSATGATVTGTLTATALSTGVAGTGVNISNSGTITGPATITIDPAAIGDDTGTVEIKGNLTVQGTTTTINSTTSVIADPVIELRKGTSITAADGGIQVNLTTDGAGAVTGYQRIQWNNGSTRWETTDGTTAKPIVNTVDTQTIGGAKTFSGNAVFNANVTLGDAASDTITVTSQFVTGTQLKTAQADTNTLNLAAYDVDGTAYTNLITLTASNTPTLALTSTGVGSINNMSIGATTKASGAFTTLAVKDTSAAFDVTFSPASSTALTANRTLTFDVINAARTIKLAGNIDLANNLTTSGNFALTLTTTAATSVTLPTSGTLVNTGVTTLSSLASIGTITTGTWNGSVIGATYGGTGVNNGSKTITLGGNVSHAGAFTQTFTATGNTSVTLPTSGTLLTTAGSGSSLTFGTGSLSLAGNLTTSGAFATTLTVTAATNVTLPTTGTLVNTAVTTLSSLASIGTITTGTWNGSVIGATYGGTGVNNGSKTITLGGNLTTSGANAITLTTSGATNVTLPTTGTLATTGNLSQFAATTSAQLAGVISDETGTGKLVFATSPTLLTKLTLTNTDNSAIGTGLQFVNTDTTALNALSSTSYVVFKNSYTFSNYSANLSLASIILTDNIDSTRASIGFFKDTTNAGFYISPNGSNEVATAGLVVRDTGNVTIAGDLTVSGGDISVGNVAATLFGGNTNTSISIGPNLLGGSISIGSQNGSGAIYIGNIGTAAVQNTYISTNTTGTIQIGSSSAFAVELPSNKTKIGQTTLLQGGAVNITLPTLAGTLATTGNLSQFAATTSAQLAGVISDETGTGGLVFNSSPTFTANVGATTFGIELSGTLAAVGSEQNRGLLKLGTLGFTDSNAYASFQNSVNSYSQIVLQNTSSGTSASSDFIIHADGATSTTRFGDLGINSTGFTGGGAWGDAGGTYLYAKDGTLSVGTQDNFALKLFANAATNTVASISIGTNGAITFGAASGGGTAGTATLTTNVTTGIVNLFTGVTGTINIGTAGTAIVIPEPANASSAATQRYVDVMAIAMGL